MNAKDETRLDLLLVYPIWVAGSGIGKLQRMLPPLGILSIASYMEAHGFSVKILDIHSLSLTPEEFRQQIKILRPRWMGVTVLSAHAVSANYLACIAKEEVEDLKICFGGVHAEAHFEEMLMNSCVDYVAKGDGEEIMLELLQGRRPEDIPGLCYVKNGTFRNNPLRPVEMNLDKYPQPAYHLINFENYFPPAGTYKDLPAINLMMTRGCPGKCNFCNSAKTVLRNRSVASMIEMIKILRYQHKVRQLYFYDDTFTANPKLVADFCQSLINDKIDVKWVCYIRGDMFRESLAKLMAEAGCHQVLIGIESGSSSLMEEIGKPIEPEKYHKVVELAHKYGIEVRASFIIGHPNESLITLEESLKFAIDLDVDFLQLNIMTPYPGTLLYKQLKEKNLLLHEDFSQYGQNRLVFKLNHLQESDLIKFQKKAFYGFYFRPKIIYRQLKRITNWNQFKDLMKAFYVIIIQGFFLVKTKNKQLEEWNSFDLKPYLRQGLRPDRRTMLTYEVRGEVS